MLSALQKPSSVVLLKRLSRSMSRSNCIKEQDPPCAPKCKSQGSSKGSCTPPPPVKETAWENGCCDMPCPDMMPRFDQIYYKRSDKKRRSYSQTWIECPEPVRKPKLNCFVKDNELPPIVKRPHTQHPKTACNMMRQHCNKEKENLKCVKISLRGCKSRRNSFHCLVEKNPRKGCVQRECAPYPSFSECFRDKPDKLRKRECGCVFVPERCELLKELERWLWLKSKQC